MTERTKPADTTEENDESGKDGAQQIVDFGSALTKTPHGSVYCMTIIGQIEGHNTAASGAKTTKYEHVLPLLAKLEESDEVNGVLFLLNTPPRPTTTSSGFRIGSWPSSPATARSRLRSSRP